MKIFLIGLSLVVSHVAHSGVIAMPAYHDFGLVMAPQARVQSVLFLNTSNVDDKSFRTTCSGDLSAYSCYSSCFGGLRAGGSCNITVYFNPRNSDGLRKTMWVQGFGNSGMTQSQMTGTDQKKPSK